MWLLGVICALLAGQNQSGHERMIAELADISASAAASDPYFGDESIRKLQAEYRSTSQNGAPIDRIRTLYLLGNYQLLYGQTEEAVASLDQALQEARRLEHPLQRELEVTIARSTAVGYLRLAENENCVCCQTGESCLFPTGPGGIHQQQRGSRKALEHLTWVLSQRPDHLSARWLLNIAAMTLGEYPDAVATEHRVPPPSLESGEPFPKFRNIATRAGIDVLNNSGGMIADDFDNDGRLDVVISSWNPAGQLRFFTNADSGRFVERTEPARLAGLCGGLNIVQTDFDNDGFLDVLVLRGAWLGERGKQPSSLLRNDGAGGFEDVSFDVGVGDFRLPAHSGSWADYDNDGNLDLYIGREQLAPGHAPPSQLFHSRGGGRFDEVAATAGVANRAFAKGVQWGDYDGDGFPDLYVSNMNGANRLFHNNRDGTFTDVALELGVALPRTSFACWFWDYNNDGWLDLFVASYAGDVASVAASYFGAPVEDEPDRLYEGDGRGGFCDVSLERGLAKATLVMGANFGDLDNDGRPDFYLGTGATSLDSLMPNIMMHNRDGKGFTNVTTAGGFGHLQKGHGIAFADFDNDGDQDVFSQLGGAYRADAFRNALYENPGFGNHWLVVELVGVSSCRCAIGARVSARITENGQARTIHQWLTSGGSFGANPLRLHLGLGRAANVDQLEVVWPASGLVQRLQNVAGNQSILLVERAAASP